MNGFVGRREELGLLDDLLIPVRTGGRSGRPGRAVLTRGRRRVGKSRLVEEFLERSGLPHVFFTAVGGSKSEDLAGFAAELAASPLPDAGRVAGFATPQTWEAALSLLASILPRATPSVVVLDEMPTSYAMTPLSRARCRSHSIGHCPRCPYSSSSSARTSR